MVFVVTGGSGSGKSEYAENLAMTLGEKRVYIATMQVFGEEGRQRVARHRKMREGKRFVTVECPVNLERLVNDVQCPENLGRLADDGKCRGLPDGSVVLLECMSNLTANEMFSADRIGQQETVGTEDIAMQVKRRVLDGVEALRRHCAHLVIVTNEVFSDGNVYDPETMEYIRCLGMVNVELAGMADQVTEVVCGIPVPVKG